MKKHIVIRLDDASEYMDVEKWEKIERVLDKHSVCPIVGIIPHNEDTAMTDLYPQDTSFWDKATDWKKKGWRIALHGYNHVYSSKCSGINPIHNNSEFAGNSPEIQQQKIRDGYRILCEKGLTPDVFFAPAHTFDENTVKALETETDIRIISDTIAGDVYFRNGFYYIPQQSGAIKKRSFRLTTIALHPNNMSDEVIDDLDSFLGENRSSVQNAYDIVLRKNKLTLYDKTARLFYFSRRKILRLFNKV